MRDYGGKVKLTMRTPHVGDEPIRGVPHPVAHVIRFLLPNVPIRDTVSANVIEVQPGDERKRAEDGRNVDD